jgi:hypothetical protein
MGGIGRTFALFLTLTIAMSCLTLLTVKPANAISSIPKPSVPEFTLRPIDNATLELTIKNQPLNYSKYESLYSTTFHLFYDIQIRTPSRDPKTNVLNQQWIDLYPLVSFVSNYVTGETSLFISPTHSLPASNSSYTISRVPNSQPYTEVQVQVIVGHDSLYLLPKHTPPKSLNDFAMGVMYDVSSGWSNTQTITIPASSSSPTPSVPELSWLIILPLLLSIFSVAVVFRHRKQVKKV